MSGSIVLTHYIRNYAYRCLNGGAPAAAETILSGNLDPIKNKVIRVISNLMGISKAMEVVLLALLDQTK